jgi:hypothetical protein
MIGALIGKAGKNIKKIQQESGCKIVIKDYPAEGGQYISVEGKFYFLKCFYHHIDYDPRVLKNPFLSKPFLDLGIVMDMGNCFALTFDATMKPKAILSFLFIRTIWEKYGQNLRFFILVHPSIRTIWEKIKRVNYKKNL